MLLREPPKSLEVSGKVYKIHTDFRLWLGLQALFQEKALTAEEKALIACRRVYGRNIPEDMNAALDALLWFYGGGLDSPDDEPPGERLLDWEQDAAAIWADFKLYYRRDLRRARMHWWDFLALFTALPEGSVIRGRMSLRAVKLGEIKDPEMRAEYARRKARVRLDEDAPDMDDFYAHIAG